MQTHEFFVNFKKVTIIQKLEKNRIIKLMSLIFGVKLPFLAAKMYLDVGAISNSV